MTCPESEVLAAHAEGRLDPAEAAALLEHAADCDGCRRELALLETGRIPDGPETALPARVRSRVLAGPASSRGARPARTIYRARPSYAGLVAAAAVAIAIVAAASLLPGPEAPKPPVVAPVAVAPVAAPEPEPRVELPRPAVAPPIVAVPEPEPAVAPPPAEVPREPAVAPPAPAAPAPAPGETKVEAPPAPTHVVAARPLVELQATDFAGPVLIRRKGASSKEKPGSVARLGEGDVLLAEKAAGFHVDGVHPVVLGEKSEVSIAYAPDDRAPWLHVRAGELIVDSVRPTRWVLTDGRVAVTLRQARARFAVAPGRGLLIGALSEPVYVQPDGGAVHAVRPGEELEVGKAGAELRPAEGGERRRLAFDAARPRQRTFFFAGFDAVDAKREHYFLEEGAVFKNEALLAKEHPDRTASAALAPNPRLSWREGLILRFRFRTNATSLQVSFPVADKRFALTSTVAVDRKSVGQWMTAEVPFNSLYWRDEATGFGMRDVGPGMRFVNLGDKFESMRFSARQQDVFGDQKLFLLLDDVQIVAATDRDR